MISISGVYDLKISGLGFLPKTAILSIRTIDYNLSGSITIKNNPESKIDVGNFNEDYIEFSGLINYNLQHVGYLAKGTIKPDGKIELSLETDKGHWMAKGKKRTK